VKPILTLLVLVLLARAASAQSPCQGGTATAPACSRNWATTALSVQVCPGDNITSAPGVRLVLRETSGAPLLSVNAGTPGGTVTLATASAPRALPGSDVRTIDFACEDAQGRRGASTFASLTFPVVPTPVAPTLLP
jgi:hypothetical protein